MPQTKWPQTKWLTRVTPLLLLSSLVITLNFISEAELLQQRQAFDRSHLTRFFDGFDYDNDLLLDAYLIQPKATDSPLVNMDLLGLDRDRLAYRARRGDEVVAIAVPAAADDGFNGRIDLLISVDMFGRIGVASVIEDLEARHLYGVLAPIESKWMEQFSGSSMRDILGISWSTITAEREYDQFVGASITPKAVADKIYDALVFYQSNRIELMNGASYGLQ